MEIRPLPEDGAGKFNAGQQGMRFHQELFYLVGSQKLYFNLLLAYEAITSAMRRPASSGVKFEVKKENKMCT